MWMIHFTNSSWLKIKVTYLWMSSCLRHCWVLTLTVNLYNIIFIINRNKIIHVHWSGVAVNIIDTVIWPSRYFTNDYYIIFCCTFIMKLKLCYIFRRLPARRRTTSTIWMYIYNQGCGKKFGAWRLYVYQSENYLSC